MEHDLTYTEANNMDVDEMLEYHDHKAIIEDMEAEETMKQWYNMPADSRGRAPYRRAE